MTTPVQILFKIGQFCKILVKLSKNSVFDHFSASLSCRCWVKLFNGLPMHTWFAHQGTLRKSVLYRTCVFHMYIVWCKLTHLHGCWRHLWHIFRISGRWRHWWHIYFNFRPFCDIIVQMLGYYLMRKYSLVGYHILILCIIVDERYVDTVN